MAADVNKYLSRIQELEEKLIAAQQETEEQNRAKDAFLANISHELRTPLNGIIGFGEIISQSRDLESIQHYADLIVSESMKLRRLINQLLDISRFASGQVVLEENPFSLTNLKDQLYTSFSSQAYEANLEFSGVVDSQCPPILLGDHFRISQVMTNLLDNAIKFTPRGQITFRISLTPPSALPPSLAISPEEDRQVFCFEVQDTGVGISEELKAKIFQRFTQADASTTRQYGGSGLGMSITHELVEKMGGSIDIISPDQGGTLIRVYLPLKQAPLHEEMKQPDKGGSLPFDVTGLFPDLRILVVEDYQPNREVLLAHLTPTNADLVTATNGKEAVLAVEEESFDLILMDVQMPHMDGYEATREIRKTFTPQDLPILGITADAFPQDRQKCLEAGMNGVIVKPLRRRQLMETILTIISGVPDDRQEPRPPESAAPLESSREVCHRDRFLTEIGDPELGQKIIDGFLDKLPRQLETLREALRARDKITAHRESHSIKGGARNIMAEELAHQARLLEDELRHDRDTSWEAAARYLNQCSESVYTLIDYIKNTPLS